MSSAPKAIWRKANAQHLPLAAKLGVEELWTQEQPPQWTGWRVQRSAVPNKWFVSTRLGTISSPFDTIEEAKVRAEEAYLARGEV